MINRTSMYRQLYQMGGGMDQMMEPQMQEPMMQEPMMQEPMMQPQMSPPLEGIMGAMPQGAGMAQGDDQGQTALLTIVQLLIEQGIDPETARELAVQILQVFSQGGEPAVEAFANQLEQQEEMQEPMMMAGGGIIALRQGAKFGKVFKSVGKVVSGVAKAVKSVAKSPIGMIALSVAAPYAIGAMFPGFATLGTSTLGTFGGAALRAGISNLAIQGITTGKINPKQALLAAAAGGALSGLQGAAGATTPGVSSAASAADAGFGTSPFGEFGGTTLQGGVTGIPSSAASSAGAGFGTSPLGEFGGSPITAPTSPVVNVGTTQSSTGIMSSLKDLGNKLTSDPLGTIGQGVKSLYDKTTKVIKENPLLTAGGAFLLGQQFRDPLPGEDPNEYNKLKAEHDAQVTQYYNQYKALMNPPTPIALAADGGRITDRQNYFFGSKVSAVATPQSGGGTGGGSGIGGMLARLVQQNSQMFRPQGTLSLIHI